MIPEVMEGRRAIDLEDVKVRQRVLRVINVYNVRNNFWLYHNVPSVGTRTIVPLCSTGTNGR